MQELTSRMKWKGKMSLNVIENILLRRYIYACLINSIILVPIAVYYSRLDVFFKIFCIIAIVGCNIMLFQMNRNLIKVAKNLIYCVTDSKIFANLIDTTNELSISSISQLKIKKTRYDIPQFKTGSIFFYNSLGEPESLSLSYIENVEEVAKEIETLISH